MLSALHIRSLAVIEQADIELADGLNAFTGSTGAGKSLVLGAIEILLGLRGSPEMIRAGAAEARVDGLFVIRDAALRQGIEQAIDAELPEGEMLLSRRLFTSGRTSTSLNGRPVTAIILRRVGELLIDIHGQHDHQLLLKPAEQLDVLDAFARQHITAGRDLLTPYRHVYDAWREAVGYQQQLAETEELRTRELDLLAHEVSEIDQADPQPDELAALQERVAVLAAADQLQTGAAEALGQLSDSDDPVLDRLRQVRAELAELARLDSRVHELSTRCEAALLELQELSRDLRRYADQVESDPEQLAESQQRVDVLRRLSDKYGPTLADVLARRDKSAARLAELEKQAVDSRSLHDRIATLEQRVRAAASELRTSREHAATQLCRLIEAELVDLGMPNARMSVAFADLPTPGASGAESAELLIAPNPGQPARPLRKIASGGELARVMLAVKSILAQADRVSVLVFDEIDANVGARLGAVIGSKLRTLARAHQVICITHLAQIAAHADRHLRVKKQARPGRNEDDADAQTVSTVDVMAGEERVSELAEMIGGSAATETTRQQAREILTAAEAELKPAKPSGKRRRGSAA